MPAVAAGNLAMPIAQPGVLAPVGPVVRIAHIAHVAPAGPNVDATMTDSDSDSGNESVEMARSPVSKTLTKRINELEEQTARLHQRLANEATIRADLENRVLVLEAAASNASNSS